MIFRKIRGCHFSIEREMYFCRIDMGESTLLLKKYLIAFCVVWFFMNMIQAYFFPIIDDEAYYWMWSQHLDLGYFDHPPMIALWISMGFSLFENSLGVRLLSVFFGTIGIYFLGLILQPRNSKEFLLFTSLCLGFVLLNVFGFIATPDSPLIFFSILFLYVWKRFLEAHSIQNTILLGICMACLLYTKYHGILLIVFCFLPHFLFVIKTPKFYLSLLVGIFCFAPHLVWQYQNNWVSFQYHLVDRNQNTRFEWRFLYEYLLNLFWVFSPFLIYHITISFTQFKVKNRFEASLRWISAGVLIFFLISTYNRSTQAQWVLISSMSIFLIVFLYCRENPRVRKWVTNLGFVSAGLIFIVKIMVTIPVIKTPFHGAKEMMQDAAKIKGLAVFEKYQTTSLYNYVNYPIKEAQNYRTLANRFSQYDLWNSEKKIQDQNIVYFSKYAKSWEDSVVWEGKEDVSYNFQKFETIQIAPNLFFEIQNVKNIGDSIELNIHVLNFCDKFKSAIKLKEVRAYLIFSEGRHKTLYQKEIDLSQQLLNPKENFKFSARVFNFTKAGIYNAYIGVSPRNLPPKKQSNWFNVNVK